jgi:glycosyltransferase involved in cell wall biosynthesis
MEQSRPSTNQESERALRPRLTIGMPVYNNAATIRRAVESLLAQSFGDFRLLVSDDGSKDETPSICQEYAEYDRRVEFVRQPANLNYGNFRYVLSAATTPLFMFSAGDDYWHPDYARRMIDELDANPHAVCAVSQVAFIEGDQIVKLSEGTEALVGNRVDNLITYLEGPNDNSRMYGVFRTDVAQRAFPTKDFHAYDWAFGAGTLLEGTHIEVPEVLMWRSRTDPEKYTEYVGRDAKRTITRVFPMLPMTADLLTRRRFPRSYRVLRQLFWLNMEYHISYLRRYHPRAASVSERVLQSVAKAARRIQAPFASARKEV